MSNECMSLPPLKPCPFCGGKAEFFTKTISANGTLRGWNFGICCTRCDITTPKIHYVVKVKLADSGRIEVVEDERQDAADAWNRRAEDNE